MSDTNQQEDSGRKKADEENSGTRKSSDDGQEEPVETPDTGQEQADNGTEEEDYDGEGIIGSSAPSTGDAEVEATETEYMDVEEADSDDIDVEGAGTEDNGVEEVDAEDIITRDVSIEEEDIEDTDGISDASSDEDDQDVGESELAAGEPVGEEAVSEAWDPQEVEKLLEGAFFAAGRPLSLEKLEELFPSLPPADIKRVIQAITMKLVETKSAMRLEEVSKDTYVLCLVSEFEELIKPYVTKTKKGLFADPAVMEVVTNVAYRQPISSAMLARVLGGRVKPEETKKILNELVAKGYVNEKEKGRSTQLTVTTKFMNAFGFSHDTRKMKLQILWRLKRGK